MPTVLFLALALPLLTAVDSRADATADAFERGDYGRVVELLTPLASESAVPAETLIRLGRAHLALGDPDEALTYFAQAVQRAPKNTDAHYWVGAANGTLAANASVFRAGSYAKEALAGFEAALALDARHVEAHKGLITYYLSAPRLFGGDRDRARELAERLATIDEVEGKLMLADILEDDGDHDGARAQLDALAARWPDDPRSHLMRGFHAQSSKDYAAAHAAFTAASRGAADSPTTRTARHMSLYQIGRTAVFSETRLAEGIAALEEYLELPPLAETPDHAWAMYRLARLYDLSDDAQAARRYYDEARERTDDKELLRQIRRFRS